MRFNMYTEAIHAKRTASISEFKKNPAAAMKESEGEPIAILSHNKPAFYCVPPALFELMVEQLSDKLLLEKVTLRMNEPELDVSLDET